MKLDIPDEPFENIIKDHINPLAIQWLINKATAEKYDCSARNFLSLACNLANFYKQELRELYDLDKASKSVSNSVDKIEKTKKGNK